MNYWHRNTYKTTKLQLLNVQTYEFLVKDFSYETHMLTNASIANNLKILKEKINQLDNKIKLCLHFKIQNLQSQNHKNYKTDNS